MSWDSHETIKHKIEVIRRAAVNEDKRLSDWDRAYALDLHDLITSMGTRFTLSHSQWVQIQRIYAML